ncbi:MAG: hypothetical protein SFU99_10650, partial [Saprospiraceae bacterium]|nr:hypothetical protein [Saprospiraceae bacterium]
STTFYAVFYDIRTIAMRTLDFDFYLTHSSKFVLIVFFHNRHTSFCTTDERDERIRELQEKFLGIEIPKGIAEISATISEKEFSAYERYKELRCSVSHEYLESLSKIERDAELNKFRVLKERLLSEANIRKHESLS